MNAEFKKMNSVKLERKRQALVHYVSMNLDVLPGAYRTCMNEAVEEAVADRRGYVDKTDKKMLKEYVTTGIALENIAMKYYCGERKVYLLRAKYFEIMYRKIRKIKKEL